METSPQFLAVLIYQDGEDYYCEEPRLYQASHPEIAYQCALADGDEQRYGRKFLGLSQLEETTDDEPPLACSRPGTAADYVRKKETLAAFTQLKWQNTQHNEEELKAALTEPPILMNMPELNDIAWHTLSHAYGTASDVPRDIRRLTSVDAQQRENAVWQLFGSIYHQGTLYPATAPAVPFILEVLLNTALPDRGPVAELVDALAESAAVDPATIQQNWQWRKDNFGEIFDHPTQDMAANEIRSYQGVLKQLTEHLPQLQSLIHDPVPDVARHIKATLQHIAPALTSEAEHIKGP